MRRASASPSLPCDFQQRGAGRAPVRPVGGDVFERPIARLARGHSRPATAGDPAAGCAPDRRPRARRRLWIGRHGEADPRRSLRGLGRGRLSEHARAGAPPARPRSDRICRGSPPLPPLRPRALLRRARLRGGSASGLARHRQASRAVGKGRGRRGGPHRSRGPVCAGARPGRRPGHALRRLAACASRSDQQATMPRGRADPRRQRGCAGATRLRRGGAPAPARRSSGSPSTRLCASCLNIL
jgi:hypothetical protein